MDNSPSLSQSGTAPTTGDEPCLSGAEFPDRRNFARDFAQWLAMYDEPFSLPRDYEEMVLRQLREGSFVTRFGTIARALRVQKIPIDTGVLRKAYTTSAVWRNYEVSLRIIDDVERDDDDK